MAAVCSLAGGGLATEPIYYVLRATITYLGGVSPLTYDESASVPPAAFGPYRVLHQIGSGVSGPVFRAFDRDGDRLIAIKAFRLNLLPQDVVRLADALRGLASTPARDGVLVWPTDAGIEGATAFVAMPLVSGQSLDIRLRSGTPATLEEVRGILAPIARALDAAGAAGLTHGALHPRDILLDPRTSEVRLTGVGVAAALDRLGLRAPSRRPYTAPERAAHQPWDARADVYALGVIAHELFTGRRPARDGEQDGAFAASIAPERRVELRRMLSMAMADPPDQRFASAAALVAALDEIARDGKMTAPARREMASPIVAAAAAPVLSDFEVAAVIPPAVPPVANDVATDFDDLDSIYRVPEEATTAPAAAPPRLRARVPVREASSVPVVPPEQAPEPVMRRIDAPIPVAARRPEAPPTPVAWHGDVLESRPLPGRRLPRTLITSAVIAAGLAIGVAAGALIGPRWLTRTTRDTASPPSTPSDTEVALSNDRPSAVPAPAPPPPAAETPVAPPAPVTTASRTSAERGRLAVRSTPSGALVFINGAFFGETPLHLRDLALGTHVVQIARPGHAPRSERVTLTPSMPSRSVSVELQKGLDLSGPLRGTIDIESTPRGARVFVDGRFLGQTPLRWPDAAPGTHQVRLELDGFAPVATPVLVRAGASARVTLSLKERQ